MPEETIKIKIVGALGVVYEGQDLLPGETYTVKAKFGNYLIERVRAVVATEEKKKGA